MAHTIPNIIKYTGRIGDYTFYQRNGKTVVRSRHNECRRRNPSAQELAYKMRLSNCNNLWRQFSSGHKPLFTQGREGSTAYTQFLSHALHATPIYLTREQCRAGGCVATDVAVSDGTLPPIVLEADSVAPVTSIRLGGLTDDGGLTVAQMAHAVLANNADFRKGDLLLYYLFLQEWDAEASSPRVRISCQQLPLDRGDDRLLSEAVGECIGFSIRDGRLAASQNPEGGMAWAHLRPGQRPQVSPQRLLCYNTYIEQYGSTEAFEAACHSYNYQLL